MVNHGVSMLIIFHISMVYHHFPHVFFPHKQHVSACLVSRYDDASAPGVPRELDPCEMDLSEPKQNSLIISEEFPTIIIIIIFLP